VSEAFASRRIVVLWIVVLWINYEYSIRQPEKNLPVEQKVATREAKKVVE
jgi:hypothetical protein